MVENQNRAVVSAHEEENGTVIGPEEGVFALRGRNSDWIWVRTCPELKCSCRSALILSASGGRESLVGGAAIVRETWKVGGGYREAATKLDDFTTFILDIDSAEASSLIDDEAFILATRPDVQRVVDVIDGDLLDDIGKLWYRGKGMPLPDKNPRITEEARRSMMEGVMVHWDETVTEVRQDFYSLDDRLYLASEMYCPRRECSCDQARVSFDAVVPRGGATAGSVVVHNSGEAKLEPHRKQSEKLQQLWDAYRKRHPRFLGRFAERDARMKALASNAMTQRPVVAAPKVGRNQACPCGSGKKYKKCCGESA